MPPSFRKRLLGLKEAHPGAVLQFEVPLDSLRSADGVAVTGDWTVSLVRDGVVLIERTGATGEDALEAVDLEP